MTVVETHLTGQLFIKLGADQYITARLSDDPEEPRYIYDLNLQKIVPLEKEGTSHD